MELKHDNLLRAAVSTGLLIVPYGIETNKAFLNLIYSLFF